MVVRIEETSIEGLQCPMRSTKRLSLPDLMDSRSLQCLTAEDLTSLQCERTEPFRQALKQQHEPRMCSPEVEMCCGDAALEQYDLGVDDFTSGVSRLNRTSQALDNSQAAIPTTHGAYTGTIANRQQYRVRTRQPSKNELARAISERVNVSAVEQYKASPLQDDSDLWRPELRRLTVSRSDPSFSSDKVQQHSSNREDGQPEASVRRKHTYDPLDLPPLVLYGNNDLWRLPPLTSLRTSSRSPASSLAKPKPSLTRLSSLDNLLRYRDEKAEWNRSTSLLQPERNRSIQDDTILETAEICNECGQAEVLDGGRKESTMLRALTERPLSRMSLAMSKIERSTFRNRVAEVGFCFTIAMTQFLAEYLISGFAIELSRLPSTSNSNGANTQSMGAFWPASLLSLILSATLLIFARLSDMYGGYPTFLFGVAWLAVWTLIPGFCTSTIVLDIARAMQGLAIAAFIPSTFAMVGSIYSEGPRKNIVLGLYSGCAPLGFFGGLFTAAALPENKSEWYFWTVSGLSGITFITAYLTVPSDRTDRRRLDLKMDWIGSILITAGLILVSYALSVEPYANNLQSNGSGFQSWIVIGPLTSGLGLLAISFWYEGWCATCPLLPFDFFKPRNVKALSLAGLCFYATYGVWLYNSAEFFQSLDNTLTSDETAVSGTSLALWYVPTAVGGIILCVLGGLMLHLVPTMSLLLLSAVAWVVAPLLLALAPLPLGYWEYVFPSMICATVGIDLTFTVSIVFLSSIQPLRYQGLTGAICSILVNLAMAFGLSISEIVAKKAESTIKVPAPDDPWYNSALQERSVLGLRAAFIYGVASAGLGLIICVLFVQISRSGIRKHGADVEGLRSASSASTLVDEREFLEVSNNVQDKGQPQEYDSDARK